MQKKLLGLDPYWAQQRSFLGAISDPYAKKLRSDSYLACQKNFLAIFGPYAKNLWDLRIWPDLPLTLVKKTLILMQKNFDGNVNF